MKTIIQKLISMLLCAALLLGCSAALAEEKTDLATINIHGAFSLKGTLAEGYKFSIIEQDSLRMIGLISSEDLTKPVLTLSIAFDESYADVERLNDLSDDELALIEEGFRKDSDVSIEYTETLLGTKLMKVTEVGDDLDYVDFYTIYLGHSIDLVLHAGPEAQDGALTQEQVDLCIRFLSDLDFISAE